MIYLPNFNSNDYPTGDGPPPKKKYEMVENALLSADIFIIKSSRTGRKKSLCLQTARKLSMLGFKNYILKKYNSYLDNIL